MYHNFRINETTFKDCTVEAVFPARDELNPYIRQSDYSDGEVDAGLATTDT